MIILIQHQLDALIKYNISTTIQNDQFGKDKILMSKFYINLIHDHNT